jgi:hypothetical protein
MEIEKYLVLQKNILKLSAEAYPQKIQEKNKKAFFYIKEITATNLEKRKQEVDALPASMVLPSAKNADTKLNEYNFAEKLVGFIPEKSNNAKTSHMSANNMNNLLNKINKPSEYFAVIQHFSTTTNVPEAKHALNHEKFRNLSAETIIAATAKVAPLLNKGKLPDEEVKTLVTMILGKLE